LVIMMYLLFSTSGTGSPIVSSIPLAAKKILLG
jgi:hypothetical protein